MLAPRSDFRQSQGMTSRYPDTVTVRLPPDTNKRTESHLAPRESLAEFWRERMLQWLADAERRGKEENTDEH